MAGTNIQWTDSSENPIGLKGSRANYCEKVSPGCEHCYAERMSKRLAAISHTPYIPYKVQRVAPELELRVHVIESWARRKKQKKNFVASMTDIFQRLVPDEWLVRIFDGMMAAPNQIFQVLTKRSERARDFVNYYCQLRGIDRLPGHIWMMVSVEDNVRTNRIRHLVATKCTVRCLSVEPLLEKVFLPFISSIDQVIVGGESGHEAEVCEVEWIEDVVRQCELAGVPVFVKQFGTVMAKKMGMKDRHGGDIEEFPAHLKIREFPKVKQA